jgi:hypothetical protein
MIFCEIVKSSELFMGIMDVDLLALRIYVLGFALRNFKYNFALRSNIIRLGERANSFLTNLGSMAY